MGIRSSSSPGTRAATGGRWTSRWAGRPSFRGLRRPGALSRDRFRRFLARVLRRDVVVDERAKRRRELLVGPLQSREVLAVDVDGAVRLLACAGERNADRRRLGFAGAVDDAA